MITDKKSLIWRQLTKGQTINGYVVRNGDKSSESMCVATIKDINASFVTLNVFDKWEKQVDSENTTFFVELTDQEFREKYKDMAAEVVKNIQNKLEDYEIGYHEMWNSWLTFDAYTMAAYCVQEHLTILGHCTNIIPKTAWPGDELDIGVCLEYQDGDKIWCHGRSSDLWDMVNRFPLRYEYEQYERKYKATDASDLDVVLPPLHDGREVRTPDDDGG